MKNIETMDKVWLGCVILMCISGSEYTLYLIKSNQDLLLISVWLIRMYEKRSSTCGRS